MLKDNDINVSEMTEDALDWICHALCSWTMATLGQLSYPVSTCSISMHEIQIHTQGGCNTEDSQTDRHGLSWVTYWSGIEKARRKRMFSQQMVLGSSME